MEDSLTTGRPTCWWRSLLQGSVKVCHTNDEWRRWPDNIGESLQNGRVRKLVDHTLQSKRLGGERLNYLEANLDASYCRTYDAYSLETQLTDFLCCEIWASCNTRMYRPIPSSERKPILPEMRSCSRTSLAGSTVLRSPRTLWASIFCCTMDYMPNIN